MHILTMMLLKITIIQKIIQKSHLANTVARPYINNSSRLKIMLSIILNLYLKYSLSKIILTLWKINRAIKDYLKFFNLAARKEIIFQNNKI